MNERGINQRRSSASRSEPDHVFPKVNQHMSTCARSRPRRRRKHHPLLVYAIVDAAKNAQFLALKKRGFKRYSTGSSTYWRREAEEPVHGATPLIFAHGIGIGFLPYHNLIEMIWWTGCDKDGAPMYLLELPALALTRFSRELPSPKELGEAASRMLAEHNDDPAACWVGPLLRDRRDHLRAEVRAFHGRVVRAHRAGLFSSAFTRCV